MKFKLSKASYFSSDEDKEKYEKLGFQFQLSQEAWRLPPEDRKWEPKDNADEPTIEINSLEELLTLAKQVGNDLVISLDGPGITIYDGYLE